jgi:hypothetical protein
MFLKSLGREYGVLATVGVNDSEAQKAVWQPRPTSHVCRRRRRQIKS